MSLPRSKVSCDSHDSDSCFYRYGHDSNFGLASYSDHWRLCRRIFHQTFNVNVAATFHPMQLRKARQMIMNVIDHPSDYKSHYST